MFKINDKLNDKEHEAHVRLSFLRKYIQKLFCLFMFDHRKKRMNKFINIGLLIMRMKILYKISLILNLYLALSCNTRISQIYLQKY